MFTDLKDNELYLQLIDQGVGEAKAAELTASFEADPDDIQDAIRYLMASNLELVAHIHMTEELAANIRAQFPNVNPECFDVALGDGFKWVIIHTLSLYRDKIAEELRQGGN